MNTNNKKNYTIRLDNDIRAALELMAEYEDRSLSNMVLKILKQEVSKFMYNNKHLNINIKE